jgi:hypothetical protein
MHQIQLIDQNGVLAGRGQGEERPCKTAKIHLNHGPKGTGLLVNRMACSFSISNNSAKSRRDATSIDGMANSCGT